MKRILNTLLRRVAERIDSGRTLLSVADQAPTPSLPGNYPRSSSSSARSSLNESPHRRLGKWLTRVLTIAVASSIGIASAQTVSVSPTGYVTSPLSGTVQFSATVSGTTNQNVNWSIPQNGKKGTTYGTISATGLYTAPATMPANGQIEILATSQANNSWKGMDFVYLLTPGPTLTSVTPNPLPRGSQTITINGTGFQQYCEVMDTSNGSPVQYGPTTWSTTQLTVSIYQPMAPNATFTVINPGSAPSNAIVVPIAGGAQTYSLTVTNGSGSGNYAAGSVVTIVANSPPSGQQFLNWTGSPVANANAATTTITMPSASAAVTANYTNVSSKYQLTVNNGAGSGTYNAGTVVTITANAPPAGQVFNNWTGAAVANANSASTTLTMPAATTSVTANYTVAQQIPFPVTTHPRLWITPSDVPRLQSWAVSTNPVYQNGMRQLLATAVSEYQTQFFPNGQPNANYPDLGDTQGYAGLLTEEVGFVLAFNSLIDPVAANRITYAQYTRNLLMYAMNQAAQGVLSNSPFRDPLFPTYNRANLCGDQWALMVDWIYNAKDASNNPILTASDKLTIRKVFMIWANECLSASTTGGDSPSPQGVTNSFSLLNNGTGAYRMASNNYYLGHARLLTMMALSIDPADDPVIDSTKSPAVLGNTLRSYILNANGAWLYQMYAMMGDPQNVQADYGLASSKGFGLASGGLPPEGMLYGHSFGFVLGQLLALQTAGFSDTSLTGPQAKLASSPIWDRYFTGFISSLTPGTSVPVSESWLGPIYQFAGFGDMLRLYVSPDFMQPFALLALLEQQQGKTTHLNAARWFSTNAVQGTLSYNVSQPWTWGAAQSILYYMLLDPSAGPASDPRPTYPLNFVDPAAGRVIAHSDWSANPTWFDYRASWESINHQHGDGGEFSFYRNGEWLTKEMTNYDNNAVGITTYYLNSLALQNWCANGTPNLNWFETGEWTNGSQWVLGLNGGDPVTVTSNGPGYTYAASDLTNLYNRPNIWTPANGAVDIKQATRSIVWLNNDFIVIYDRATSTHSGLFKTFNMSLATSPAIAGNTATETMADGQQLFVQTLLPSNATLTSRFAAGDLSPHAELDPMNYVLTVQDKSLPTDTRFLHVLQGANAGAQMIQAARLTSTTGTAFDGAVFGSSAVFFPTNVGAVSTTSFGVPATVHTFVIAGLTSSGAYGVTTSTNGTTVTVTLTPGGSGNVADSAGLLKLSF